MGLGDGIKKAVQGVRDNVAAPLAKTGVMGKLQGEVAEKLGSVIQDLAEVNGEGFLLLAELLEKLHKDNIQIAKLLAAIAGNGTSDELLALEDSMK